ncbi:MAG TPA: tetratricopeptide repeat protein [Chthonomonadaceae bacterium]|nr:tetratricopeptide repeat protein [Chthonomonadaceae bacterium]
MLPPETPPRRVVAIPLLPILIFSALGWIAVTTYLRYAHALPQELDEAKSALHARNVAKATALFDAAIRKQPHDPAVYVDLGQICSEEPWDSKEHRGQVMADYAERGLRDCPHASDPDIAALDTMLALGDADAEPAHPQTQAIQAAQEALRHDPDNPVTLNLAGYLLADNDQDLDLAKKDIAKALQDLRQSDEGHMLSAVEDSYGWVLYKQGDYKTAIEVLQQAINDTPEETTDEERAVYYYHLGSAYVKAGDPQEARQALELALRYDPNDPDARAAAATLKN